MTVIWGAVFVVYTLLAVPLCVKAFADDKARRATGEKVLRWWVFGLGVLLIAHEIFK